MEATETMEIIPSEVQVKIDESKALSNSFEGYAIGCADKYQNAATDLKAIKTKAKELNDTRMSLTRPLEESKKRIIALFKVPLDYLINAESVVKRAMVSWQAEQEEIRQAEQKRLAEIQRKEAEKLRLQAEKEAARAAELKTDSAKARAEAKAESLKAQAEMTTAIAPVVESQVEEVSGISTRKVWKFEIVNAADLPREYMIPDEKYIGQIIRASKGKKEIPGVRIYSEDVISSRI